MPVTVVKYPQIVEVSGRLDEVTTERKALELRLKDANDFLNRAELESEPIYIQDELGKVSRNARRGDDIQKKLDRAQGGLGDVTKLLDNFDKKADEAVRNNPNLKPQADSFKLIKLSLRKRIVDLNKIRDDLQKRLKDAHANDDPRKVKEINRQLDQLDKEADDLNIEVDKLKVQADKLDDDFDKQNVHSDKERQLEDVLGARIKYMDDLERKLRKLHATIDGVEPLQVAIEKNPDFASQQDGNKRFREHIELHRKEAARVAKEKKKLDGEIKEIEKLVPHMAKMDIMELDDLIGQMKTVEPTL